MWARERLTCGQRIAKEKGKASGTLKEKLFFVQWTGEQYGGEENEVHGDREDTGDHEAMGGRFHAAGDRRECELREIDGERHPATLPQRRVEVRGGVSDEQRGNQETSVSIEG